MDYRDLFILSIEEFGVAFIRYIKNVIIVRNDKIQRCAKRIILLIIVLSQNMSLLAQVLNSAFEETYLGQIFVYKFTMDSLSYRGKKELSAVGKEYMASLFSSKIGENIFFKLKIDGESYAVVSNPYGNRVSYNDYYAAWILKEGNYLSPPKLTHMAGTYLLTMPYSVSNSNTSSYSSHNESQSNSSIVQNEKQTDWQLMGKVYAVYNIRTTRSGGEDDVIYDEDIVFLYSSFDGNNIKYKITVPKYESQYEVYNNSSYNGSKVQWDRHGKRVWSIPSLSEMFTHRAGKYYFNVDEVKQ